MATGRHYLAAITAGVALAGGPAVGSASAGTFLCVPATAGAVTSGGTTGSCGTSTPIELPTSRADQQTLLSVLPYLSFNAAGVGGKPTITVKGANLQVVNGAGSTTTPNGAGNLILGYNEYPGSQTGSHSLVMGQSNSFTSYGNLVHGTNNKASAPWATAVGYFNTASGPFSSVLGGYSNTASNFVGVVAGGHDNVAKGESAAILGGNKNRAEGTASSVSGGFSNVASGAETSVLGGNLNTAIGKWSTLSGGKANRNNTINGTGDGTRYWVRVDANGVKVADSGTLRGGTADPIDVYHYSTGWTLVWLRGIDVSKCSVSAEPDGSDTTIGYRYYAGEYVYVQTMRAGVAVDGVGLSVSLDCKNPT